MIFNMTYEEFKSFIYTQTSEDDRYDFWEEPKLRSSHGNPGIAEHGQFREEWKEDPEERWHEIPAKDISEAYISEHGSDYFTKTPIVANGMVSGEFKPSALTPEIIEFLNTQL